MYSIYRSTVKGTQLDRVRNLDPITEFDAGTECEHRRQPCQKDDEGLRWAREQRLTGFDAPHPQLTHTYSHCHRLRIGNHAGQPVQVVQPVIVRSHRSPVVGWHISCTPKECAVSVI